MQPQGAGTIQESLHYVSAKQSVSEPSASDWVSSTDGAFVLLAFNPCGVTLPDPLSAALS
jgi:hypothetical protein